MERINKKQRKRFIIEEKKSLIIKKEEIIVNEIIWSQTKIRTKLKEEKVNTW